MIQAGESEEMTFMEIQFNTPVECRNGPDGRCTQVIVHPRMHEVISLVVKERGWLATERLVPMAQVMDSTPDLIRLRCSTGELANMKPVVEAEYVQDAMPFFMMVPEGYAIWPGVEHHNIPPWAIAVCKGTHVEATDGALGQIGELLFDPANRHITHLVLRTGCWWDQKSVVMPASQIERMADDTIYVKICKHDIEALPTIQLFREMCSQLKQRPQHGI
jgi:uncharacterized protein YrrD